MNIGSHLQFEKHPEGDVQDKAGVTVRCFAVVMDIIIPIALLMIVSIVVGLISSGLFGPVQPGNTVQPWIWQGVLGVGLIVYSVGFESRYGQTPGKKILGLVVTKTDGSPIGLKESIGRNVARLIDVLPAIYILGAIVIWATDGNQRIGDLIANTSVVAVQDEGADPQIPTDTEHEQVVSPQAQRDIDGPGV
jgi:uncharacterized RDD family membrane protein YckC